MSNGILVLAQNSEKVNYVDQACALALSIKKSNPTTPISIITDDIIEEYAVNLFDKIIPIPWGDLANKSNWKIENRWKIYHCSPYNETIVLDTDMIVLQDISHWWKFLKNYDVFFTTNVMTYRDTLLTSNFYRKTFESNNLPNFYSGFHYFKKSDFAHQFYTYLELVMNEWKKFYDIFLLTNCPQNVSVDVCAAIVAVLLDCVDNVSNRLAKIPYFIHMKPQAQDWTTPSMYWQDSVNAYVSNDGSIKIGNHLQSGILHYTEKNFLENTNIIKKYRELLNV